MCFKYVCMFMNICFMYVSCFREDCMLDKFLFVLNM